MGHSDALAAASAMDSNLRWKARESVAQNLANRLVVEVEPSPARHESCERSARLRRFALSRN